MEGLAASGVTNTYGSGEGQNTTHHYAGTVDKPKKKKSGIHIKKANKGKFTKYCGGNVTNDCIARGLKSSSEAVRKRAQFAKNARKWKH